MKYAVPSLLAAALALPAIAEAPGPTQPAAAQTPAAAISAPASIEIQPQPVAVLAPLAQDNILRAGAEVPLIMREELTTEKKKLRVGQRFQMEVAANIERDGVVVIPAGTPAVGEVTDVRNKGMWGKSGYINARVISLRYGDRVIRLSGTFDDKGVTGTAGVVGAVALVPIAGFFMTGTSAKIPASSPVKAFLEEDVVFRTIVPAPQVVEVPGALQAANPAPVPPPLQAPAPIASSTLPVAAPPAVLTNAPVAPADAGQ